MLQLSGRRLGLFSAFSLAAVLVLPISACSSANDGTGAPASCSGLDTKVRAQATLRAYAEAVTSLRDRAAEVEGKFLTVCNAINSDLGLDSSKTTAQDACGVLKGRIDAAAKA